MSPRKPTPAAPSPSDAPAKQPTPTEPTGTAVATQAAASVADKLGIRIDNNGNLDIASLAYVLQASKLFADITSVSQGIAKILVGKEIGLGPMASVMGIHIIRDENKNRTSIMVGAHLVAAKIKGSGRYDYDVIELDPTQCLLQPYVKRDGEWRKLKEIGFTIEDAKLAGYGGWGKDGQRFKYGSNWAKDPQAMCFARATTRMEKVHFADLTGLPIYTPDELGYRADDSGDPLVVKGQLVRDDMPPEEEAKLKENGNSAPAQTQNGGLRMPITRVQMAKLDTLGKQHGWPVLDMFDMIFEIGQDSGYVDESAAEVAWSAQATQRLMELVAADTFDIAIQRLSTLNYQEWKAAQRPVDGEYKEVVAQEEIQKGDLVTADGKKFVPPADLDASEEELTADQYSDLWSMISQNPEVVKAVKAHAKTLGYSMLRKAKQKDLSKIIAFAQEKLG